MKRVYSAANEMEAHLILGVLEPEGIRATILGGPLLAASGEIPRDPSTAPAVWVLNDEDYERAREIIIRNQPEPAYCPNCGYNLTGLPDPRCPECGEPFGRSEERAEPWSCPGCGEQHEGQFSECWNCGRPRPGSAGSVPGTLEPPPTKAGD